MPIKLFIAVVIIDNENGNCETFKLNSKMKYSTRINEIINEAVKTQTISIISADERLVIAKLYKLETDENLCPFCDACIVKACFTLNNLNTDKNGKRKK